MSYIRRNIDRSYLFTARAKTLRYHGDFRRYGQRYKLGAFSKAIGTESSNRLRQ